MDNTTLIGMKSHLCDYCSQPIEVEEGFPGDRDILQFGIVVCKGCAYLYKATYESMVKSLVHTSSLPAASRICLVHT